MARPRKMVLVPPPKWEDTIETLRGEFPRPAPSLDRNRCNIAIVGCYPGLWEAAPFADKEWEIWGFSRRHMGKLPRCDKWFELHDAINFQRYETEIKGYNEFLIRGNCEDTVVLQKDFPSAALLERFGPYFLTSGQAPWLLAYAISLKPAKIGIWGVEAREGYPMQRYELQHFIQIAKDEGIEVIVPEGCTILERRPLYGFESKK